MDEVAGTLPTPLVTTLVLAIVAVAAAVGLWWRQRQRAARSIRARLTRAGVALLADVLLPDGDAGELHVEYLVLTGQGIVLVDVRDVAGHVFGSEAMQEWAVLGGNRRQAFANPLPALYDRVAALRRLLPDVPVRGVVAFTQQATFTKGVPPNVTPIDRLLEEIEAERSSEDAVLRAVLEAAWARLGAAAQPRRSGSS
ncbi:MAG: NERD domain-containing protein [Gammaproteobacteria bacterium]|nr:NERD domain-containing protein [Gammaproteobacteria bacterium]